MIQDAERNLISDSKKQIEIQINYELDYLLTEIELFINTINNKNIKNYYFKFIFLFKKILKSRNYILIQSKFIFLLKKLLKYILVFN